jgi:hypothetical protein
MSSRQGAEPTGSLVNDGATLLYRATKHDCDACELKPRCCPKMPARKVPRSIHEQARDAARDIAKTDAYPPTYSLSARTFSSVPAHIIISLHTSASLIRGDFVASSLMRR